MSGPADVRRTGARFAAFAVASLLLLVLLVNTMRNGLAEDARSFTAEFTDVSGLRVGDDVKVAGVRVGRVSSIEVAGRGAEVGFELADEQPILTTTRVVMRYQNLIGQRYLALEQGPRRGPELEAGTTIPVERTSPGFDLTELLNGFRPLFEVLEPADVNALATSVVKVLQGEGGTVEQLLRQTTRLSTFVADRDDLIGSVLGGLTPVLMDLEAQDEQFTGAVADLRTLMSGLARERRSIGASIDGVGSLVEATTGLLDEARAPAVETARQLRAAARRRAGSRDERGAAVESFDGTMGVLARATSYENALNIYLCSFVLSIGPAALNPVGDDGPWSEACR